MGSYSILYFLFGVLFGSGMILLILRLISSKINIIKNDYELILKGDDGKVIKKLGSFTKFYWNDKNSNKDIRTLMQYCDDIRTSLIRDDNYLFHMIDENYEVDYTKVYLIYEPSKIKPL